ncbi:MULTISPECIES: cold shock domain-containing protein [unclassified Paenibacillus]|jgi:cold shock protein|nr:MULTISPECIES: cold shock domain-containing protein [unclassified Paenibacillus]
MGERRWGIVKWFKEDKGYGRIMLDGHIRFPAKNR